MHFPNLKSNTTLPSWIPAPQAQIHCRPTGLALHFFNFSQGSAALHPGLTSIAPPGLGTHYCTLELIAFFLTSPIVNNGSLAPVRGAIHFFSLPIISSSNFLSAGVGSQLSSCWRYSFSSNGSPVLGWKNCAL